MSAVKQVLDEFLADKKLGVYSKKWSVIPKEQYRNLLERYMEDPIKARIPYSIVEKWLEIVKSNTKTIRGISELWSRGKVKMNISEANEYFNAKHTQYEMREKLDSLGFFKWAVFQDGKPAYSDIGLKPLENILAEEQPNMTAEDILILINRCLNVVHPRNDLASAFIEGGSKTCSEISGK